MSAAVPHLPEAQLNALLRGYADAVAAKRRRLVLGVALFLVAMAASAWMGEVAIEKFVRNFWRFFAYFGNTVPSLSLATLWADLAEWFWGLKRWLRLLGDTIMIAYVGTLIGVIGGFCLCFLASANLVKSRAVVFVARRTLEFCRTVPEIVFALIFVLAYGLGPLPGVLAIAIHTTGALGKLFAEVVENIDPKPLDGVAASGGNWFERIRFAVLPQVLSNFVSYALLRFEINVRGAAVMGFVGAGGIGQDLIEAVRKFYYTDVSAILILVIITVMIIDGLTERVRHALIGTGGAVVNERPNLFAGRAGIEQRYPDQFGSDWQRRSMVIGTLVAMTTMFIVGLFQLEIPFSRLIPGTLQLGDFVRLMLPPDPGTWTQTLAYLKAMGETLSIAFLGTLGGAVLAFPMALLAARNVVANRIVHFLSRRWLDTIRGVDTLIWALIWVSVVGLGPFAGILALVCSDFGSFGKLFSEAIETADKRPVEGVLSTGGSHVHGVRFGLLPQIIPVLASQILVLFRVRTRARPPSSASSAPAASASSSPSRSACSNGRRWPSSSS